jgi:hypothetical protein
MNFVTSYGEVYKFSSDWNLIAGRKLWGLINVKAPSSQRISSVSKKPYGQFSTIFFLETLYPVHRLTNLGDQSDCPLAWGPTQKLTPRGFKPGT